MINVKMKFRVSDLVTILVKNRETHVNEYTKASKLYRKKLVSTLEKLTMKAKAGKKIDLFIRVIEPQQYTKEYDSLISMLKSTSDKEIELDSVTHQKIVQDEWDWSNAFNTATLSYTKKLPH